MVVVFQKYSNLSTHIGEKNWAVKGLLSFSDLTTAIKHAMSSEVSPLQGKCKSEQFWPTLEHTEAKLLTASSGLKPLLQLQSQLVLSINSQALVRHLWTQEPFCHSLLRLVCPSLIYTRQRQIWNNLSAWCTLSCLLYSLWFSYKTWDTGHMWKTTRPEQRSDKRI